MNPQVSINQVLYRQHLQDQYIQQLIQQQQLQDMTIKQLMNHQQLLEKDIAYQKRKQYWQNKKQMRINAQNMREQTPTTLINRKINTGRPKTPDFSINGDNDQLNPQIHFIPLKRFLIDPTTNEIHDITDKNNTSSNKNKDFDFDFMTNIVKNLIGANITNDLNTPKKDEKDEKIEKEKIIPLDLTKDYKLIDNKQTYTLDDLIELGKLYETSEQDQYAIDLKTLNKLIEPLEELKSLIGMEDVKQSIVNQIIYFIQRFDENDNMLHTIIQGPPGVGKTLLGIILAKIYYNLGIIPKSKNGFMNHHTGKKEDFSFKIVKRSDLIGKYLGHTAAKTQEAINSCEGGVMFIDEVYSLGEKEGKDSYAKECIDTINQNLSENKKNFICIIAGYPDQIDQCFFSYNEGLRRRFAFKYTITEYTAHELAQIFEKKTKDCDWNLDEKLIKNKLLEQLIEKNIKSFSNFGGDIETLLLNAKISHSARVFSCHPRERKIITIDDIRDGFDNFLADMKKKENATMNSLYL